MSLIRTIQQLELALTADDAEAISRVLSALVELVGAETAATVVETLRAERRVSREPVEPPSATVTQSP